ncbi:MAG: SDR family NAD(P)-dependent oxidoreductase, partial [Candidatus Acidiferrales bacterium]
MLNRIVAGFAWRSPWLGMRGAFAYSLHVGDFRDVARGAEPQLKEAAQARSAKQLFDLTGRVAIVTGGSIGLGRQMAEGLADMGAHLVLCARKKERCQQAAEELQAQGASVLPLACDVRSPESIQEVVDAALARFGRIDILINNAGTSWGAPVEEMRLEDWNKVI